MIACPSPARVTMLAGLDPVQHGITEVLELDNITQAMLWTYLRNSDIIQNAHPAHDHLPGL